MVKLNLGPTGEEIKLDPKTNELSDAVKGRSVDISVDGKMCAVGFRDGSFRVYRIDPDWEFKAKKRDRKRWIQAIRYSPNGRQLAVGSHDGKIDIYDAATLSRVCELKGPTSFITHLDWSLDSQSLKTNDASYEILYFNVANKSRDPSGASGYRDEHWATWTCILGWTV